MLMYVLEVSYKTVSIVVHGIVVVLVVAHYQYDTWWNAYDYDCCINRLPNVYSPSLAKRFTCYYRCHGIRVVYGRCPLNQCVTIS